jgi:hypothetical protein
MVFPAAMADMEDMPSSRAPAINVKMLRFIPSVSSSSPGHPRDAPIIFQLFWNSQRLVDGRLLIYFSVQKNVASSRRVSQA